MMLFDLIFVGEIPEEFRNLDSGFLTKLSFAEIVRLVEYFKKLLLR